jgi:hypothetical protein
VGNLSVVAFDEHPRLSLLDGRFCLEPTSTHP